MDASQFKEIFIRYSKEINNYIYFLSGNENLSRDLTQDTFLKLWERADKIKMQSVGSFLYTIARNLYLDQYRREQVKFKYWKSPRKKVEIEHPEYLLEQQEFHEQLTETIEGLPEPQRVVFLMNRIEKLKYREIANKLDISIKTVEKRMQKALLALHKLHKKI